MHIRTHRQSFLKCKFRVQWRKGRVPRYMNPPTQIFQSLKTEKTRRQDKYSYAELPLSLRNFSIMNSRSGSDKNFASSGKSTMTKYPTIERRQVAIPSKMKTRPVNT
jgi:hypothetical protein